MVANPDPDEFPSLLLCSVALGAGIAGCDAAAGGAEATSFFLPPHPWERKSAAATPIREKALYIIQVSVKILARKATYNAKITYFADQQA
jgi:hypothetical protein